MAIAFSDADDDEDGDVDDGSWEHLVKKTARYGTRPTRTIS